MKSVLGLLAEVFSSAIGKAFPSVEVGKVLMRETKAVKFGDYQCNNAMELFKRLQKLGGENPPKNVHEVAKRIVAELPTDSIIAKTEIAGPGFINVFLSRPHIGRMVDTFLKAGITPPALEKKRVVVDFSSPNIAKQMHVGHLRSTILGEMLCRIFEFCEYDTLRVNHVGDWGTQFGMLIRYLKDEFPNFKDSPPHIADLQVFYQKAKKRFDDDEDFKQRAKEEVVKLQSHDTENIEAWKMLCEVSRAEFNKIYKRLNVSLEECGESFYNPLLPKVAEELTEKGLTENSDGALCMFVPNFKPPLMVRKTDGGYTYDTTDLAAIKYRLHDLKADWLVYVVDAGQGVHFDLVFEGARMAGWVDESKRVDHVGFGLVCGEDGKKFKTRSGDTVKLADLLDEAVRRAKDDLSTREAAKEMSPEELEACASDIGYSAVKYADLKQNRSSNYIFSYDRMLDLKGDTAVYLMYAYARICQIVVKAETESDVNIDGLMETTTINITEQAEYILASHLLRFPDSVSHVLDTLMPHHICGFVYELSGKFNDFYRDCRVVGHENMNSRLLLCEATRRMMLKCFELIGISPRQRI